jgi:phage terminase small subunit
MDIAAALSEIATVLGIVKSIKDLMKSEDINAKDALQHFRKTARKEELDEIATDGSVLAILSMANDIPDELLEQMQSEIDSHVKRHVRERRKAHSADDANAMQDANERAQRGVCRVLNDIKRHNSGNLPDSLQTLWRAYRCG